MCLVYTKQIRICKRQGLAATFNPVPEARSNCVEGRESAAAVGLGQATGWRLAAIRSSLNRFRARMTPREAGAWPRGSAPPKRWRASGLAGHGDFSHWSHKRRTDLSTSHRLFENYHRLTP